MDKLSRTVTPKNSGVDTQKKYTSKINQQTSSGEQQKLQGDPRIDSPDISVVYPSVTPEFPSRVVIPEIEETEVSSIPEEITESKICNCKTDWLTAIKQNGTHFLLMALVLLIIGYALGKK